MPSGGKNERGRKTPDGKWRELGGRLRKRENRKKKRAERRKEEKGVEERQKRERNVVWRGVEGEDLEERRWFEKTIKKALGRIAKLRDVEEKKRKAGKWVIIMELEEIGDKEEILGSDNRALLRVGMDEDLSMGKSRIS